MEELTSVDKTVPEFIVKPSDCESIEGNVSKTIEIDKHTKVCEIQLDIEVEKRRTIRLWGQVRDCRGNPVSCALVKLVKEVKKGCSVEYEGVAHGVTDCLGFYQFDICLPQHDTCTRYRVIVSKQAMGKEIIIKETECRPCTDSCSCAK